MCLNIIIRSIRGVPYDDGNMLATYQLAVGLDAKQFGKQHSFLLGEPTKSWGRDDCGGSVEVHHCLPCVPGKVVLHCLALQLF